MDHLSASYLSAVFTQIGSLSAFLGGFAATYLATLLTISSRSRSAGAAIATAALAAVLFIVAVIGSTMLVAVVHPDAPAVLSASSKSGARVLTSLTFALGVYSLLTSIACSGWMRTRATGLLTSSISIAAMILVTYLLVDVG